jgi:hypothetical protein
MLIAILDKFKFFKSSSLFYERYSLSDESTRSKSCNDLVSTIHIWPSHFDSISKNRYSSTDNQCNRC